MSLFPDAFPLAVEPDDTYWVDFLSTLVKVEESELEKLWVAKCRRFEKGELFLDSLREFVDEDKKLLLLGPEILWKLPDHLEKWLMVMVSQQKVAWEAGNDHAGYLMKRLFSFALHQFQDPERFLQVLIDFFINHDIAPRLRPILVCQILSFEGSFQEAWSHLVRLVQTSSFPEAFLPAACGILKSQQRLESWEQHLQSLVSLRGDFSLEKLFADPVSSFYISQTPLMLSVKQGQCALLDTYLTTLLNGLKSVWQELPQGLSREIACHLIGLRIVGSADREEGLRELQQWNEIIGVKEEELPGFIARLLIDVLPKEKRLEVFIHFAEVPGFPEVWKEAYFYLEPVEGVPLIQLLNQWKNVQAMIGLPASSAHAVPFFERAYAAIDLKQPIDEEEAEAVVSFWKGAVEGEGSCYRPLARECLLLLSIIQGRKLQDFSEVPLDAGANRRIASLLAQITRPCTPEEVEWLRSYQINPLALFQWTALMRGLQSPLEKLAYDHFEAFSKRALALWMAADPSPLLRQDVWLLMAALLVKSNNPAGWKFLLSQVYEPFSAQHLNDYLAPPFLSALLNSCCPVPTLFHLLLQMNGEKAPEPSIPLIEIEKLSVFEWIPFLQILVSSENPLIQAAWVALFNRFVQEVVFVPPDSKNQDLLCAGLMNGSIGGKLKELYPLMAQLFDRDHIQDFHNVFVLFQRKIQEEIRTKLKGGKCIPPPIYRHFTKEGKLFHQGVADKYLAALLTGKPA